MKKVFQRSERNVKKAQILSHYVFKDHCFFIDEVTFHDRYEQMKFCFLTAAVN